jgi:hypothetical protein
MYLKSYNVNKILEPTVKDGTPCKRGSKKKFTARKCRNDDSGWVLHSDAMEVHRTWKRLSEIVTIPRGFRFTTLKAMKPKQNFFTLRQQMRRPFISVEIMRLMVTKKQKLLDQSPFIIMRSLSKKLWPSCVPPKISLYTS